MEKIGNTNNTNKFKYILLLIFQCAIFGLAFTVLKSLLKQELPVFSLLSIRFLIGAISLFIVNVILCFFQKKRVKIFSKDELLYGLIIGFVVFIAFGSQTLGLDYTTPAKSGLFTGLYVIFVPTILMCWKRKTDWKTLLLGVICFVGVSIVSGAFAEKFNFNIGDGLTILCALFFAIYFIMLEKILSNPDINFFNFIIMQFFVVSICSFVVSMCIENVDYGELDFSKLWLGLLFLGILSTALTEYIQIVVQSKLSAYTVSVLSCSESVFAVIFAISLGYDSFSLTLFVGTLIIIVSMILTSVKKDEKVF